MPDPWVFGSYTVPADDSPWYESSVPEVQEDVYIEDTPIGAEAGNATIATWVSQPSIGAQGTTPFVLRGECGSATRAIIEALRRTEFTLKSPFDVTGQTVLLTKLRLMRWTNSDRAAVAGTGERFHYWMELLGRGTS